MDDNIEDSKEILNIKLRAEVGNEKSSAQLEENVAICDMLLYIKNIERELIARNNQVCELLKHKKYNLLEQFLNFIEIIVITIIISYYIIAPIVTYGFMWFVIRLGV